MSLGYKQSGQLLVVTLFKTEKECFVYSENRRDPAANYTASISEDMFRIYGEQANVNDLFEYENTQGVVTYNSNTHESLRVSDLSVDGAEKHNFYILPKDERMDIKGLMKFLYGRKD